MYKHSNWKKWKETNYLYSIENDNGDCVTETTTQPNSEFIFIFLLITMMMVSIDWRFLCQFRSLILIEKKGNILKTYDNLDLPVAMETYQI